VQQHQRWRTAGVTGVADIRLGCDRLTPGVFAAINPGGSMSKRELIDTGTDKRYVRRDAKGQFKESDDVGKSLSQDVRKAAKTKVKAGQGDRGDRKR
jgi:hypothetical protein